MTGRGQHDVVVVGGRVAGASTAMLLARAGLRVLLLDRSRYGSDTLSTHALMRAGVLQLSRWGLLEEVVAAGTPPVHRTLFHYADDDTVQVSIRPGPGVPALFAPRRHILDTVLVDAAARAGVDVRHRVHVTGVSKDETGRVTGVHGTDAGGHPFQEEARLTVGADGIRSVVAQATGAPCERLGAVGGAVLYAYVADLPTAGYEWAYGPGVAAGLIPTNDGLTCVFAGTTPDRLAQARRSGSEDALASLFAAAAPAHRWRLDSATRVGRVHGWAGAPGCLRRCTGPGWALVGDAGYFRDPITTHGMTDALRDAELLSQAVLRTLSGVASEQAALADYQRVRDTLSSRVFDVSGRIAAYDWDTAGVQRLLREVSSAMSDEVSLLQALAPHPSRDGATRPGMADTRVAPR
jgi:2-polyprenyl-6-methoxyphenol hydroxylase-like FAD-dependent oxidoreductase